MMTALHRGVPGSQHALYHISGTDYGLQLFLMFHLSKCLHEKDLMNNFSVVVFFFSFSNRL